MPIDEANETLLFFEEPGAFHRWLEEHHETETALWVGYYKKATGHPSLTWPESVDQALCFGWIDGIRKTIDERRYKIRFTPRKPASIWSAVNMKRYKELDDEGRIAPAGKAAFSRRTEKRSKVYSFEQDNVKLPKAFLAQIKADPEAWNHFRNLSTSVKKQTIWYVMSAKREETRQRRLGILIDSSREGRKIPPLRRTGE